jgi:hypothetical protein
MPLRCVLWLVGITLSAGSDPIANESIRLEILKSIFPKMAVEATQGRTIDTSRRPADGRQGLGFDDALKNSQVYRITGAAQGDAERCAAEDINNQTSSEVREVRFQAYEWPGGKGTLSQVLAVAQYRFVDANPAFACPSIGRLLRLIAKDGQWTVSENLVLETTHHSGLQAIRLIDLFGDGREELLIESDFGGSGLIASDLTVFGLADGKFDEWLRVRVHAYGEPGDEDSEYTQALDLARTRSQRSGQFCFVKTAYAQRGKPLAEPRISYPCYPRHQAQ